MMSWLPAEANFMNSVDVAQTSAAIWKPLVLSFRTASSASAELSSSIKTRKRSGASRWDNGFSKPKFITLSLSYISLERSNNNALARFGSSERLFDVRNEARQIAFPEVVQCAPLQGGIHYVSS